MNEPLQLPCLGRPFSLGMLYDCRNDNLLLNTSLWENATLEQATESVPQRIKTDYDIITDDSIDGKCYHLEIGPGLKLSLISGLVKKHSIAGSGKYFYDHSSSEYVARVSVMFKRRTDEKQLNLEKLGKPQFPDIIDPANPIATHVVTRVLHGVNGVFVFDRVVGRDDKYREVHKTMQDMVEALVHMNETGSISTVESMMGECSGIDKYQCKFYGDFSLPKKLSTFHDAVEAFKGLSQTSGEHAVSNSVSTIVFLCPLTNVDSRFTQISVKEISPDIVCQVQHWFENLYQQQSKVSELLNVFEEDLSKFQLLQSQLHEFKDLISKHVKNVSHKIALMLQSVRDGSTDEHQLENIFLNGEYPFDKDTLSSWLKQKETEIEKMSSFRKNVSEYQYCSSLKELQPILDDINCSYVVCLVFNTVEKNDDFIEHMKSYLGSTPTNLSQNPKPIPNPWYRKGDIIRKIKEAVKQFTAFAKANNIVTAEMKVVVADSIEEFSAECGFILLYKDAIPKIWVPPGPPSKPCVTNVTSNSVQLSWEKPEYGSENVTSYIVLYRSSIGSDTEWKTAQEVDKECQSVLVTGLAPQETHTFVICSMCEVGFGCESEISQFVETLPNETQAIKDHKQESSGSSEIGEINVKSQTKPQLSCTTNDGKPPDISSSENEVSDLNSIITQLTSIPEKPTGYAISDCSIKLKWNKPQASIEPIQSYSVIMSDLSSESSEREICSVKSCEATIPNLTVNSTYIFKVQPKYSSGIGATSEASDPITTMPTSKPLNLKSSNTLHNSVQLTWEKPEHGSQNVKLYTVLYHLSDTKDEWKERHANCTEEYLKIEDLDNGKRYDFKVRPECGNGAISTESDILQIQTKVTSPPNSIRTDNITYNSVALEWPKPEVGGDRVNHYKVFYQVLSPVQPVENWMEYEMQDAQLKTSITKLKPNTSYIVKVCAVCADGEGAESETKILQTKPFCKPGQPQLKDRTHTSIQLYWTKPEYGSESGKILNYAVFGRSEHDGESNWDQVATSKSNATSVQVTGLKFNTSYYFKVCPQCRSGSDVGTESKVSDRIETLATSKPEKIKATSISHNTIELKWTPPSHCDKNNIKGYTIFYQPRSSPGRWEEKQIHANQGISKWSWSWTGPSYSDFFEESVCELTSETEYVFKVCAECIEGTGAFSDECTTKTKRACRPGKPQLQRITHNTIQLKWTKPRNYSEKVRCYNVLCQNLSGMEDEWMHKQKTIEPSCTVSDLTPATKYIFKVSPECNQGTLVEDSEVSDEIETCVTSPPGNLTAVSKTHDSVHLKWNKPTEGSQNILSYTVSCTPLNGTKISEFTTTIDKESEIITNLKPGTGYKVSVHSNCSHGMGSISTIRTNTELQCQPGKPKCTGATHNGIGLEWSSPKFDCHKVEQYVVQYRNACSEDEIWQEFPSKFDCNSAQITGLIPGTKYEFKVYPTRKEQDIAGATYSDVSDEYLTKTISKPLQVIASNITNNSINLQWKEPLHGSDKIQCYTIIYDKTGPDKQSCTLKTDGKQEQYMVEGLCHNVKYKFTVRPESGELHDQGCESDVCTVETKAVSKPGKPKIISLDDGKIKLQWERPQYHSKNVKSYSVLVCKDLQGEKWTKHNLIKPNNAKIYTCDVHKLACGTKYRFKIKCECISGIGDESDISDVIETKGTSRPGKPILMPDFERNVTHESIYIKWSKPQYGKDNIQYYVVSYRSENAEEWLTLKVSNAQESVLVSGLSAGTKHMFKVCPVCSVGDGTESDISDPIETKVTSPPGKPVCIKKTHKSVQLEWKKPSYVCEKINSFLIKYCEDPETSSIWKQATMTEEGTVTVTVDKLKANTVYTFKVLPQCSTGIGAESDVSDLIRTNPVCCPGKPYKVGGNNVSIELEWERPEHYSGAVVSYTIHYHSSESPATKHEKRTVERAEHITITGLDSETSYEFKVQPECSSIDIAVECSEATTFKTDAKPAAEEMKSHSELIADGPPARYQVPVREIMKDKGKRIAKYAVGLKGKNDMTIPEKVLMVVGATGAGKTTLINGIANYIFYTQWEDEFRFQLITEEQKSQTRSQTTWITSYTIYPAKGCRIKYKLTVIDTPGFGDTEGIDRDKRLVQQIKDFFTDKGIDQIHGIGFIIKAPDVRLTPTQRYIFDQILAIYGKDIAANIFVLITFCDGQDPPVLAAVNELKLPYKNHFKFNNSALYARPTQGHKHSSFDKMFWDMGVESFETFFTEFERTASQSLSLTRQVLDEREHLETLVQGLQQQVYALLNKMEELRQEEKVLETHQAQLIANKGFKYYVELTKQRKVDLANGQHVTNCLTCNFTCHEHCYIARDDEKYRCAAMKMPKTKEGAYCGACTKKCFWSQHVNNPYRFEFYKVTEERTSDNLKEKYDSAVKGKNKVQGMITRLKTELEQVKEKALEIITDIKDCLERLQEIALKPNPLNEEQYIDLLIQSEKAEAKEGFIERIKSLEEVKKRAKVLALSRKGFKTFDELRTIV